MIDQYMVRQIAAAKAAVDRFASEHQKIRVHAEEAARAALQIRSLSMQLPSRFEKIILQDRTTTYLREIADVQTQVLSRMQLQVAKEQALIVHGMMQRAMGVKDSAKCLMAIKFLIFARTEKTK